MIIGIDLGLQGAIATITNEGRFQEMFDMPIINIKVGKRSKNKYDIKALSKDMYDVCTNDDFVFIEDTQPMVGVRVQASYGLGYCKGLLVGMLSMRNVSYELVRPRQWQKHFGITGAKGDTKKQSYLIASQLFPTAELTTPRGRKLDGRCDALLIAEWGRRHLQGEMK